jgi:membrane protease YdiL (CAAX protease family)
MMFPVSEAGIDAPGWYHVIVFGLLVPVLAWRSRARLAARAQGLGDRTSHFKSTAIMLGLFTGLSLIIAMVDRIQLFPEEPMPPLRAVAAGVVMYVLAVAFMRPRWRRAVQQRKPIVSLFMPETPAERSWWIGVSLLAGFGEEITWRGVQVALLTAATGSYVLAGALSAISFGLAHLVQGWKSAGIVAAFGAGFQTLVWLSGSLYVAMAVHVAYDITAGLMYGKLGRELGYAPAQPVTPA